MVAKAAETTKQSRAAAWRNWAAALVMESLGSYAGAGGDNRRERPWLREGEDGIVREWPDDESPWSPLRAGKRDDAGRIDAESIIAFALDYPSVYMCGRPSEASMRKARRILNGLREAGLKIVKR